MSPRDVTAATLRKVAEWGLTWSEGESARDELLQIAQAVESMDDDEPCCPVCEEVLCDEGCPLAGVRIYERRAPEQSADITPAELRAEATRLRELAEEMRAAVRQPHEGRPHFRETDQ